MEILIFGKLLLSLILLTISDSFKRIVVKAYNEKQEMEVSEHIVESEEKIFAKIDRIWSIPPLKKEAIIEKLGKKRRDISQHIIDNLGHKPLCVKFYNLKVKRRRKIELNQPHTNDNVLTQKYLSWVTCRSNISYCGKEWKSVKKLQSIWSINKQSSEMRFAVYQKYQNRNRWKETNHYLEQTKMKGYEEAVIDFHGTTLDLEILLPKKLCGCFGTVAPVILYRFPIGPGLLEQPNDESKRSPKTRIAHSRGLVIIYPKGRRMNNNSGNLSLKDESVQIGYSSIHIHTGPGIIDDHWARGKRIFWNGKHPGLI